MCFYYERPVRTVGKDVRAGLGVINVAPAAGLAQLAYILAGNAVITTHVGYPSIMCKLYGGAERRTKITTVIVVIPRHVTILGFIIRVFTKTRINSMQFD